MTRPRILRGNGLAAGVRPLCQNLTSGGRHWLSKNGHPNAHGKQSISWILWGYIGGGHRILYRDYATGCVRVLIQDPCPCGLPEMLTIAVRGDLVGPSVGFMSR